MCYGQKARFEIGGITGTSKSCIFTNLAFIPSAYGVGMKSKINENEIYSPYIA